MVEAFYLVMSSTSIWAESQAVYIRKAQPPCVLASVGNNSIFVSFSILLLVLCLTNTHFAYKHVPVYMGMCVCAHKQCRINGNLSTHTAIKVTISPYKGESIKSMHRWQPSAYSTSRL